MVDSLFISSSNFKKYIVTHGMDKTYSCCFGYIVDCGTM